MDTAGSAYAVGHTGSTETTFPVLRLATLAVVVSETVRRGTVGVLAPGWQAAALPLTAANDNGGAGGVVLSY